MTEEPTHRGFVARLQAKSDSEGLSYIECKYKEAMGRVEKKNERNKIWIYWVQINSMSAMQTLCKIFECFHYADDLLEQRLFL